MISAMGARPHEVTKIYCIVAPVIFSVLMFIIRPSHLGEAYNFIGCSLLFLMAVLATFLGVKPSVRDFNGVFVQAMSFSIMWMFFAFHAIYNNVPSPFPVYSAILASMVAYSCILILSNRQMHRRIIVVFVSIVSLLGISAGITLILSIFIPTSSMYIFTASIPTYKGGDIYFPLTMSYGERQYEFLSTIRISSFWRESGIAQAIYAWACVVVLSSHNFPYRKLLIFGCIVGSLSAQSTLSFGTLGLSIALYFLILRKTSPLNKLVLSFVFLIFAYLMIYISVFDENIGLASKLGGDSYFDRSYAMSKGIESFLTDPMGYGVYGGDGRHSGINLIASLGSIGIIGLLLFVLCICCMIQFSSDPVLKLISIFPIVFTMVTSQPLLDAMGVYIIMMLDSKHLRPYLDKAVSS